MINENKIISALNKAEISIDIAVSWITSERIISKIEEKRKQGVVIKILCWKEKKDQGRDMGKELKDRFEGKIQKGEFEIYEVDRQHCKFCIIDEKILIDGSYNWTEAAKGNDETFDVDDVRENPEIRQKIEKRQRLFDKIYEKITRIFENEKFKKEVMEETKKEVTSFFDKKMGIYIDDLSDRNEQTIFRAEEIVEKLQLFVEKNTKNYMNDFSNRSQDAILQADERIKNYINEFSAKNKTLFLTIDDRIEKQRVSIQSFEKRVKLYKGLVLTSIILIVLSAIIMFFTINSSMNWYQKSSLTRQEVREELLNEFKEKDMKLYKVDEYNKLERSHQILEEWISKNPRDSRKFIQYRSLHSNEVEE